MRIFYIDSDLTTPILSVLCHLKIALKKFGPRGPIFRGKNSTIQDDYFVVRVDQFHRKTVFHGKR